MGVWCLSADEVRLPVGWFAAISKRGCGGPPFVGPVLGMLGLFCGRVGWGGVLCVVISKRDCERCLGGVR